MSIFDSKQEIFDIQLTSHGKKMLSRGNFKPAFYAFFDDEVLYDAAYASGSTGANGVADERIRIKTPYLKTQYSLLGSEIKLSKQNVNQKIASKITSYETETLLKYPLGNAKLGEITSSYIDTQFLGPAQISDVTVTGSLYKFDSKNAFDIKRPKIILKPLEYKAFIKNGPDGDLTIPPELIDPDSVNPPIVSPVLSDSKYIRVDVEDLLVYFSEENAAYNYNNFEVTVHKINKNDAGEQEYEKLSFANVKQDLVSEDGFLIDPEELPPVEITAENVEFYFDILTDEEINAELLSSRVPRDILGVPIIKDPLVKTIVTDRTRVSFVKSDKNTNDGEPC